MRHLRSIILGATLVGLLASCASDSVTQGGDAQTQTTVDGSLSTVGFTASLVGGGSVTLTELLADKPVALWFWAPG